MDESAHDWRFVKMGRELGWTGVALKTCKTQTGAILSLCWAKAHGMTLMVQDLTNPMLAQIPLTFWEDTLGADITQEIAPGGVVNPEMLEQIIPTLPADLKASLETQLAAYNR